MSTNDNVIGFEVFDTGGFEFHKFEKALQCLGRDSVTRLVDVGANIGVTAIPALARNLTSHAVLIEPDPLNFRLLTCNLLLNSLEGRTTSYNVAATRDGVGNVSLQLSTSNHGDHRILPQGSPTAHDVSIISVPGRKLDDLVPNPSSQDDLLWLDVQGFEAEVLSGATTALAAGVPIVLEYWPFGLRLHNSLLQLEELLSNYESFVDLSQENPKWRSISELSALNSQYILENEFTDILVTVNTKD